MANFPLFKKQKEAAKFLFDPNWQGELAYGGGARGGKSRLGSAWVVASCLAYPESAYLVGFAELKHLRRTTLPDILKTLKILLAQDNGENWQQAFKVDRQDMIIEFINGSKIFLAELADLPSDPDFDRLGSYSLTGVWIDEAQRVSSKAKSTLSARLSLTQGKGWKTKPKALYTCNPSKDWIYSDFYKPLVKENQNPPNKVFIQSLYTDNPFIDHESYKQQVLGSGNKSQIQRLLYGNFDYDDDPSKLIEYDKIMNLWTNSFIETGEMFMSCDIAMQGSDKLVIFVWSGWRVIEIYTEAKSDAKHIEELIKAKAEAYKVPRTNIVYDADGLGAYLRGYLEDAKPFVNNAKPLNGENYQNLKTQCYYKLADKINQDEIFINFTDQSIKEILTEELDVVKQHNADKDGKLAILAKDKIKELLGRSPDISDAMAYRILFDLQTNQDFTSLYGY